MAKDQKNKVPFAELSAEELQKVAIELEATDADLLTRVEAQNAKEEAFGIKNADLLASIEAQTAKEEEFGIKAAALDAREKDLSKREKAVEKKEKQSVAEKSVPGLKFEFEGEDFKFKDDAPKLISINGKGFTQQEIADDPELALELIGGNSGLIEKV